MLVLGFALMVYRPEQQNAPSPSLNQERPQQPPQTKIYCYYVVRKILMEIVSVVNAVKNLSMNPNLQN